MKGCKYSKDYVKIMKSLEDSLMDEKTLMVDEQNKEHFQNKCLELIANRNDDFSRASAILML